MTAAWMAYSLAISCLLSIAALAVERACRLRRWPSRWTWTIVLAAPFLLPFTAQVADRTVALVEAPATATVSPAAHESRVSVAPALSAQPAFRMDWLVTSRQVAAPLGAMWILTSALLAAGLAFARLRMNRRAASWTRRTLDGTDVLVSADIGPAVIGFRRPQIVVPEWLFSADHQVRRLALAHESQHVQARDPLLLFAATMAVVLMPWNLPLWWQWRRLRFAIEVDCDTRVLASGRIADVEYAEALLNVAERSSDVPLAAAAMCESASTLEKRIHLFLLDRTTWQRAVALVLLVGGIGVAATAAQIDAPVTFGQSQWELIKGARGSALVHAIADGDRDTALALIDDGADVDRVVLGDGSPLIVAARTGDLPLVNRLLERGAQVDIAVRGDGSPLIVASNSGNLEIMTTLVERGADVNGFVLGDETPLINAARAGRLDAVRYLVSSGADVNLAVPAEGTPGAEIRSPLGEALKHEHRAVADYLRSQGAQR
jgi:beta-lactamase regulating signal transducer with metallopeptidase domain/ankyrin repeat protein